MVHGNLICQWNHHSRSIDTTLSTCYDKYRGGVYKESSLKEERGKIMKSTKKIVLFATLVLALSVISNLVIAAGLPRGVSAISGFTYGSYFGVSGTRRYGAGYTNALSPTTGKSS